MPYRINARVDEQNHYRCHAPEAHYIGELESRGNLIRLDNICVDAEQLIQRAFQCDSTWCLRCSQKDGKTTYKGCCCTDLEVDLTAREIELLEELARLADERLSIAPSHPLRKVVTRMLRSGLTEQTEKGEQAIKHLASGRCPMSWMDGAGVYRCGINSLCNALELPLAHYKPDPCYLFPLHYVEYLPGKLLLTVICEETYKYCGADAYIGKLRCLRKPQPGAPPAFQSLKYEIILCLGEEFFARLEQAAAPYLAAATADESYQAAAPAVPGNGNGRGCGCGNPDGEDARLVP